MQFPVNLNLAGRRCLLVGAGPVGLRKAHQLLACGADLTVIAPEVHPGFRDLDAHVLVRAFEPGDTAGFRLVITATGDPAVDQLVYDEAEGQGVWVNSADDPERCTFTLPAVVRRGPVLVTASTGGVSPALSAWLREQLEAVLDPALALVAADLAAERARVHAMGERTEGRDWRPVIEAALAAHGVRPPSPVEVAA